jgi:hypothetical protein
MKRADPIALNNVMPSSPISLLKNATSRSSRGNEAQTSSEKEAI